MKINYSYSKAETPYRHTAAQMFKRLSLCMAFVVVALCSLVSSPLMAQPCSGGTLETIGGTQYSIHETVNLKLCVTIDSFYTYYEENYTGELPRFEATSFPSTVQTRVISINSSDNDGPSMLEIGQLRGLKTGAMQEVI